MTMMMMMVMMMMIYVHIYYDEVSVCLSVTKNDHLLSARAERQRRKARRPLGLVMMMMIGDICFSPPDTLSYFLQKQHILGTSFCESHGQGRHDYFRFLAMYFSGFN